MSERTGKWIACLIAGLDEYVNEETRVKILEQCGRQCQSRRFIKKARSIYQKSRNVDQFLEKLSEVYKHLHREKDKVFLIYPKCYCSQVNKLSKGKLSRRTATVLAGGLKRYLKEHWKDLLKLSWNNR